MNQSAESGAVTAENLPLEPIGDPTRCHKNRFHPTSAQCSNDPVWRSTAPLCEAMVWCDEHAPDAEWRTRLIEFKKSCA